MQLERDGLDGEMISTLARNQYMPGFRRGKNFFLKY